MAMRLESVPDFCVTRFAPSPTGYLHLGHVLSAIFVYTITALKKGRCLLRIEDHDRGRSRQEYSNAIMEDLTWLGFVDDKTIVSYQSQQSSRYQKALEQLASRGLAYGCDCSRKDIEASMGQRAAHEELRYAGTCRNHDHPINQRGLNTRVILPSKTITFDDILLGKQEQTPKKQCGDILAKDRDGNWTYQFAVTVDDLEDRVDLIVRGEDLLQSTGRQILLRSMLEQSARKVHYLHHPLIKEPKGRKLSKRFFSQSISEMRKSGEKPEDVIGKACYQGGIIAAQRPTSLGQLRKIFTDV